MHQMVTCLYILTNYTFCTKGENNKKMRCFNIVIVDDDDFCIKVLKESLSSYPNIQIAGEALNPNAGKKMLIAQRPDLLFLDVEMPGKTGVELLREIHEQITWPMQVVFYTAYNRYLLDALRSSAFDYLLKPIEKADLKLVMERFFNYTKKKPINTTFQNSLTPLLPSDTAFMVATITGFQVLQVQQIGYFTYHNDRKQWAALLSDQSQVWLKRNTNAKDILKYSLSFVQINQQQIINIGYLAAINGKQCILYPPFDINVDFSISRSYFGTLQDKFSLI